MPRQRTGRPGTATERAQASGMDAGREAWRLLAGLFKAAKGKQLAELELTPAQAQLLWNLDPGRPVPMNELAGTLGCDASNVTGLVDRLEARNLIERRADPDDRRVKMIAVTRDGAELRVKLRHRLSEPPAAIASLPEGDKQALLDIMRKATADTRSAD